MLTRENKLTILYDDNGTFADYSSEMQDLSRDENTFTFTTDDFLYVGFEKPLNSFYIHMEGVNTVSNTLSGEFYHKTDGWTSMDIFDETKGFTRSGFIHFDRNEDDNDSNESTVAVDSKTKYFYRFSTNKTLDQVSIRGINIVFSDDNDLKLDYPQRASDKFYPEGESSHILYHVSSRNQIISDLRKAGNLKYNTDEGKMKDLNAFDLLKIEQVNEAAKFLALSKIFYAASDEVDDVYMNKGRMFETKYKNAFNVAFLNIDVDDDGVTDTNEEMIPNNMQSLSR